MSPFLERDSRIELDSHLAIPLVPDLIQDRRLRDRAVLGRSGCDERGEGARGDLKSAARIVIDIGSARLHPILGARLHNRLGARGGFRNGRRLSLACRALQEGGIRGRITLVQDAEEHVI